MLEVYQIKRLCFIDLKSLLVIKLYIVEEMNNTSDDLRVDILHVRSRTFTSLYSMKTDI